MEDRHPITHLLNRYLDGNLSDEEKKELAQWTSVCPDRQLLLDSLKKGDQLKTDIQLWNELWGETPSYKEDLLRQKIHRSISSERKSRLSRWMKWSSAAAAVLFFVFLVGRQVLIRETPDMHTDTQSIPVEILSGGNKAYLHFGDSRTIELSDQQSSIVWDGNRLLYGDGSVIWNGQPGATDRPTEMLTLVTPRGGVYQVTLPDSTRVWLNAASSLRYPSRFDADKRLVQLEGEGYFEVATDPHRPFLLESDQQVVRVLGTAFNMKAYPQEAETRTTLLRGKIEVWESQSVKQGSNRRYVLAPGQQAVSRSDGTHRIVTVDPESFVAWRKGILILDETELSSVLRHISRWYDVEIDSSQVQLGSHILFGRLDGNLPLSNLLSGLEMNTDFTYTIKERRVIVNK